jgi:hypothetical protein
VWLLFAEDSPLMMEAMRTVVESYRLVSSDTRKRAGLTIQDVFFTEITSIDQVRAARLTNVTRAAPTPLPPTSD